VKRNGAVGIVVLVALVVAVGVSFVGRDSGGGSDETASAATTTSTTAGVADTGSPTASTPGPTECAPLGDLPAGVADKPTTVDVPTEPTTGDVVTTVLQPGTGAEVTDASYVTVDYLGISCSSGQQFDSSWDRGEPITIAMPQATPTDTAFTVIDGWNQGLLGQQQGALVQLDIPSDLAYGEQGNGGTIAPNDPLTFVIRIREVSDTPPSS